MSTAQRFESDSNKSIVLENNTRNRLLPNLVIIRCVRFDKKNYIVSMFNTKVVRT